MAGKLARLKKGYYVYLDREAKRLAEKLSRREPVGRLILQYIEQLYVSARVEKGFSYGSFEVAYHNPISSELEFLIARIFHHYSDLQKLDWKIYLRRQVRKTAPDIRIEHECKTLAIIEIKAKAGWIQPFFSSERARKDMIKLKEGKSDFNPNDLIKKVRGQLEKYHKTYDMRPNQVFILLPSLVLVHRKRSRRTIEDYENDFSKNSGLPKDNLILLSNNPSLDLGSNNRKEKYAPTDRFEKLVNKLAGR